MPHIDFLFQGYVRGANIQHAVNAQGVKVDVSQMDAPTLAEKLEWGQLFIALGDFLYDNNYTSEIELLNFEPSNDGEDVE